MMIDNALEGAMGLRIGNGNNKRMRSKLGTTALVVHQEYNARCLEFQVPRRSDWNHKCFSEICRARLYRIRVVRWSGCAKFTSTNSKRSSQQRVRTFCFSHTFMIKRHFFLSFFLIQHLSQKVTRRTFFLLSFCVRFLGQTTPTK